MKRTILFLFLAAFLIFPPLTFFGQGLTSSIGDRENLELFGGPASDLSFAKTTPRLFATVDAPATLMFSDDNGMNWIPAFPYDSLEYNFGSRGWGGRADKVLTNQLGWVAVKTGIPSQFSASVISYNNGDSFQTACDAHLLNQLIGQERSVTAIDLTDFYIYTALNEFLVRTNNSFPYGFNEVVLNAETFPGSGFGAIITGIASSNNPSGFPVYLIVDYGGSTNLYTYDGAIVTLINIIPASYKLKTVFTHKGFIDGSLVFISGLNQTSGAVFIERSFDFGNLWDPITPQFPVEAPLSDADFHTDWVGPMPVSEGLRLSIPGGIISDDLGDNWEGPAVGLGNFPIATFPFNINQIYGSDYIGIKEGFDGIYGPFIHTQNFGFNNINVNDIDHAAYIGGSSVYYVATDAGLAYTNEYNNPGIFGYDLWQYPNGGFPIDNVLDENGITAVAIDPDNPNHVIAGCSQGFYITTMGADNFFPALAPDWNISGNADPFVTDIKFINSDSIIAVTGIKHKKTSSLYTMPIGNIWHSFDGGFTWNIAPTFGDFFEMGNCLDVGFDGNQTVLYAGTGYSGNQYPNVQGALWSSLDNGENWFKLNDAPSYMGLVHMPIYDIDMHPFLSNTLFLTGKNALARTDDGGANYFIADIPYNRGKFTSALINPLSPDTIIVSVGRNIYKYNIILDDADLKFKGLPGELFTSTDLGSTLGGSNSGFSKIEEAITYLLNLKVFIEGPFEEMEMRTDLYNMELLPLEQPFNQAPWYYSGTESVDFIPSEEIVDWVLIELRKTTGDSSSATAETRFDRQAAFLLRDGTIVDDDGFTNPRFSIIFNQEKDEEKAYAEIYAPGHVNERSSSEMQSSKSQIFSYDFTLGENQAYGGGSAHKELAEGIWGMISGDANQDGQVENIDKQIWLEQNGNVGYYPADFNRNGNVNSLDLILWRLNAGRGSEAAK